MSTTDEIGPGLRRAAMTLVALGAEGASAVLREMEPEEVVALSKAVLSVGAIPAEQVRASLAEISAGMGRLSTVSAPTPAWLGETLSAAFTPERAAQVMATVTAEPPFAWAAQVDPDVLAQVLDSESPAPVAIAIAHLQPALGAKMMRRMDPTRRAHVAAVVAGLDSLSEDTIRGVDQALAKQVGPATVTVRSSVDGVATLTALLQNTPRSAANTVLAELAASDPTLAGKVRQALFTFTDVLALPQRHLQQVLAALDMRTLATALFGSDTDTVDIVFNNITERAAMNLREEIDLTTAARASAVRAAHAQVVATAMSLETQGKIVIDIGIEDDEEEDTTTAPAAAGEPTEVLPATDPASAAA